MNRTRSILVAMRDRVGGERTVLPRLTAWLLLVGGLAGIGAPAKAQSYSVLYNFADGPDGAQPYDRLIQDSQGNLYGTTATGGLHIMNFGGYGFGVVFKLDPSNNETPLYTFTDGSDGDYPFDGLIMDTLGNLYGTASLGGLVGQGPNGNGYGVVFRLNASGNETPLYTFTGGSHGAFPYGGLIQDKKGNLYGTTFWGGNNYQGFNGFNGAGVVFKLDLSGNEKVLHTFSGGADGANPFGLIQDKKGNLYGTTEYGGEGGGSGYGSGNGVVYTIDKSGNYTVLYTFTGGLDGANPIAPLIQDAQGNLYGTTQFGGAYDYGVVFKLDKKGNYTMLYTFTGGADGAYPYVSGLIRDKKGNLYGTTYFGGSASGYGGDGVVFKVDTSGNQTVLHTFAGQHGATPVGGLLMDKEGNLYGTANYGGTYGWGVVYKISSLTLESVTLKPRSVKGGQSATGTVMLSGPAPPGGALVTLGSSNSAAAQVPPSTTVQAGQTTGTFTITTSMVSKTTKVVISATYNGTTKTAKLKVKK